MTNKFMVPYGAWKSPITSDLVAASAIRLGAIVMDGADLYWSESRPAEGGRNVIVRQKEGMEIEELTPEPFNVRTRVHEYGGGAFTVHRGTIVFSNFADQRLYKQRIGRETEPWPVTPEERLRYADGLFAADGRYVCVREDHRLVGQEAVNTLVSLTLDGKDTGRVLVSGNDFYASPRFSPDGKQLAWLTWNHPNMPWDGTELWLADYDAEEGSLANECLVAGGVRESIYQPEWSPAGELLFVSDRSGWWNLYRHHNGTSEALHPLDAEFGQPQWLLGMHSYAFVSATVILCIITSKGEQELAFLDMQSGTLTTLALPFTAFYDLHVAGDTAYFFAASPVTPESVISLELATVRQKTVRRAVENIVDEEHLSVPQTIEFPTTGGLTAFAFYYPPHNEDYQAPPGQLPPLMVQSHGGPTSAVHPTFHLGKQFWTSRGFAVLDVNYGGSSGYGRAYRERLNGKWGIVDVEDCINGARYLVELGMADGQRLAIRGGSAGGYTTLCVLTFRDEFRAGASHFGVSDVEALARDTHKFESRYLDNLIGPYPEQRELYLQRSPIHFTDQLNCPLILFQGLEDRVVPPSQAELMFAALQAKGIPVAYLPFEGEQHGFRRAENIKRVLEAELYFYGKVFGFEPADMIATFDIENLPAND